MALNGGALILFYWIKKVSREELLNSRNRGWGNGGKPLIRHCGTGFHSAQAWGNQIGC